MTNSEADKVWRRDEIESPCVQICVLHPVAKLCMGCYRSRDEIAAWSRYSPQERREIMAVLPARESIVDGAKPARRGRRGRDS